MRVIASVSRLSVRNPYGADLGVGAPTVRDGEEALELVG
jgi:hypothetical protein